MNNGEMDSEEKKEAGHGGRAVVKSGYPYVPFFFLLVVTVGQGYVSAGLQAVLELYFVDYLFVCSGTQRATSLGTTSVNIYIAIYQLCAISAGFLADKVIGNFLTQTVCVLLTSSGVFLLAFSTWQFSVTRPDCCQAPLNASGGYRGLIEVATPLNVSVGYQGHAEVVNWTSNCSELHKIVPLQSVSLHMSTEVIMVLAILGLVLYAVGYGHTNTLQSVFVADQFKEESESKRRSFSWFYLCCNLGALGGESALPVLRQSLGFVVAWLTLLGSTGVSTVIFLSGSCLYVKKKPERLRCDCLKSCRQKTSTKSLNTSETTSLLNSVKTKPSPQATHPSDPTTPLWALLGWLKQLLPFLGVFGPLVVFWAVFYQQNTTWVVQGTHMNCHIGKLHVPPDLMPSVNDFLVVVIIPSLEYIIYPHLQRTMRIKIEPLHKLVTGMSCAGLSFLMSGLLQLYVSRYPHDDCHGDVSLAWQLPQLFFISVAEAIVCVTGLEFAYSQAPPQYRNVLTSMWYLSQALGTLLNAGVAQIHKLGLLQEFFTYMSLMALVTVVFAIINRRFQYRTT